MISRFLFPVLLFIPIWAQEADKDKLATVAGIVVNSLTTEPVTKATVSLHSQTNIGKAYSVSCTPAGTFAVKGIEPGTYTVLATRQGFLEGGLDQSGLPAKVLTLHAGDTVDSVKIAIVPQGIIAGHVTDVDGEPLEGATVIVHQRNWLQGGPMALSLQPAVTNDLGEFRVANLAPGRYFVEAVASGNPKAPDGETYPPVFSPGVTNMAQAIPIQVAAGQIRQGIDIRMIKLATHRVRGKIVAPSGGEIPRNSLSLSPRGTTPKFILVDDGEAVQPDGSFEFPHVLPGSYFIAGFTERVRYMEPVEVGDKDLDNVVVRPVAEFNLTARIRWDCDPQPTGENAKAPVNLEPLANFNAIQKEESENNTVLFKNVPVGPTNINVNPPPGYYVKAIRYGNQELEADTFEAQDGAELEIIIRPGPGSLEGNVTQDDSPAADSIVVLVPVKKNQLLYQQAVTDQAGHFKIENITPGEYDAYAFAAVEVGSWFDPGFSAKFGSRAEHVKIEEKGKQSQKLTLIKSSGQ